MANAPNVFQAEGGHVKHGVAGGTVNTCKGLTRNSLDKLVHADNTTIGCVGISRGEYVDGDVMNYHSGGSIVVKTTGTVVPGDYLRISATAGVFEAAGTSGATAKADTCILISRQTADADGYALAEWL
jgi:hypothetical protein